MSGLIKSVECTKLHQIIGDIDLSPDALQVCFIFSDFAPYRKQSASKLEIDTKSPSPVKIEEGTGEMSEGHRPVMCATIVCFIFPIWSKIEAKLRSF